jgi:hypothetical protein
MGDTAAVTALLARLLHHAHVLKWGPSELAYQTADRIAYRRGNDVELTQPRPAPEIAGLRSPQIAGFQLSTEVGEAERFARQRIGLGPGFPDRTRGPPRCSGRTTTRHWTGARARSKPAIGNRDVLERMRRDVDVQRARAGEHRLLDHRPHPTIEVNFDTCTGTNPVLPQE